MQRLLPSLNGVLIFAAAPAVLLPDGVAAAPAVRPGVYPSDFGLVLDLQATRKFTANDIQSFVHHVFSMYERATSSTHRVGAEAFRPLIDDSVQVDFPDYKIHSWKKFVAWHRWIHDQLIGDDHALGPIDVRFLGGGRYEARFFVLWRALFKDGNYREMRIEQIWTMREQPDRDLPVIEGYVARVPDTGAPD
ncbi:MAG: hypothetical protein WCO67_00420 [Betaproteobacteria bacterium]